MIAHLSTTSRPERAVGLHRLALLVLLTSPSAGCASFRPDPPPLLQGGWEMSTTVNGVDYVGLLTFTTDGLVFWDGELGERNVCEAVPGSSGGGYDVTCPLPMWLVPNDAGALVATVTEITRGEAVRRRCLRREERAARMVCVEWETTPFERTIRRRRRIVLEPADGRVLPRSGGGGGTAGPVPPG